MPVEEFQAAGTLMALSELTLKFKTPLRAGDKFYVSTAVTQVTGARLVLHQSVVRLPPSTSTARKPFMVCEAQATVVFLDKAYRPIRTPAAAKHIFQTLMEEYLATKE